VEQERHGSIFNTQSKDFSPKKRRIPLAFFLLRSCVALLARGAAYRKKEATTLLKQFFLFLFFLSCSSYIGFFLSGFLRALRLQNGPPGHYE